MTTIYAAQEAATPADTALLSDLAAMHKACGDLLRLEILRALRHNAFGVLELCNLFDVRQPAMSHHLKVLAKAGLVETQRRSEERRVGKGCRHRGAQGYKQQSR